METIRTSPSSLSSASIDSEESRALTSPLAKKIELAEAQKVKIREIINVALVNRGTDLTEVTSIKFIVTTIPNNDAFVRFRVKATTTDKSIVFDGKLEKYLFTIDHVTI